MSRQPNLFLLLKTNVVLVLLHGGIVKQPEACATGQIEQPAGPLAPILSLHRQAMHGPRVPTWRRECPVLDVCKSRAISSFGEACLQGQIVDSGSFEDLKARGVEFKHFELRQEGLKSNPTHLAGAKSLPIK